MITLISNKKLNEKMLPSPTDERAIRKFASTFNGYEYIESLPEALKRTNNRQTLSDIRSELFHSWRATRHNEGIDLVEVYKELQPLFIKFIIENNENT